MLWVFLAIFAGAVVTPAFAQAPPSSDLLPYLERKVEQQPDDASAWRLLGKLHYQMGRLEAARDALQRAIELNPENPAPYYDLGFVLSDLGHTTDAKECFRRCIALAPLSPYASDAEFQFQQLTSLTGGVQLASFEVDWLDTPAPADPLWQAGPFPGSTQQPWTVRLDVGLLFNSNVELAPISRQLSASQQGSFQVFLAPDVQYTWNAGSPWEIGNSFQGYFNFNENHLQAFNLEHYQPAVFVQHHFLTGRAAWTARSEYRYAYDAFDGDKLGSRHGVIASLARYGDWGNAWMFYASADQTEFASDGATPAVTSLDGWNYATGAVAVFPVTWWCIDRLRTGVDVDWADLEGSAFRYHGFLAYAQVEMPVAWDARMKLKGGWGIRDYPDFPFSPERDEDLWTASAIWRKRLHQWLYLNAIFTYDRFASANDQFDASRYTAGGYLTFQR